jgi:hypothetical protein
VYCTKSMLRGICSPAGAEAMKQALKFFFLLVLGAVLLAMVHSHAREHSVPHPQVLKVSLAKAVAPQPRLLVRPAIVTRPLAEHLIAIGVVVREASVAFLEAEPGRCHLRGPPHCPCCPESLN